MPRLHFEDFTPGTTTTYGPRTFGQDEIIAFAREFDPQPMHVDAAGAGRSFYGTLIASGWHLCAASMRMLYDGYIGVSASMGSPGIDETRWQKPVKPGDTMVLRQHVLERRESKSRPDMGLVLSRSELVNQHGEICMTQTSWGMMGRRDVAPGAGAAAPRKRKPATAAPGGSLAERPVGDGPGRRAPLLDELAIGRVMSIGAFTFTPEAIKRFARDWDPQPFHMDEEAAKQSAFGGLCASGWHTASVWMKLMIAHRQRQMEAAAADGEHMAKLGPSPGFRNLRWLKPVYAGDTISYYSVLADKRPSASRPQWGLVFSQNVGENQNGERVFEFMGSVLWARQAGA
ncbi:MaoC family dehydratase [Chelatococcus reniformis]|nr:MaoC family dehydratase [Chelatococcus reniformis]